MIKGTPQKKRNSKWHKKHERDLAKRKRRQKNRKGISRKYQGKRYKMKEAMEFADQRKLARTKSSFWHKLRSLLLKIISRI